MEDTSNIAPGTLAKFHLGLTADGASCAMVFVDDQQHSIACIAGFADLEGFISSLAQAATEMARRRAAQAGNEAGEEIQSASGTINVTASSFEADESDGTIRGLLIGDGGEVIPVQMRPQVANEITRNMLRAAHVASSC